MIVQVGPIDPLERLPTIDLGYFALGLVPRQAGRPIRPALLVSLLIVSASIPFVLRHGPSFSRSLDEFVPNLSLSERAVEHQRACHRDGSV